MSLSPISTFLGINGTGKLWLDVAVAGVVIFIVSRVLKYFDGLRSVSYIPGIRCAFDPLDFPGGALPSTWWNPGTDLIWLKRFELYRMYGSDTVSIVPFLSGHAQLFSANLDVARQVVAGGLKSAWIKPERVSRGLMYKMVWQKTLATYHDWMIAEEWGEKDVIDVPRVQQYTFKLALLVIAACGFGISYSWSEPPTSKRPDGTEAMSMQEALRVVSETITIATLLPKWARKLPFKELQRMQTAHEELETFMLSQIEERKTELRGQLSPRDDVFSLLIRANEEDSDAQLEHDKRHSTLSDQELIANVFVLLFAGHETTAHTLAAALGLLSLHPEIQEEVFDQIISVVGCERDPAFEDYDKLDKVVGVFYEALRLFPSGAVMIREATEDTVLHVPNPPGIEGEQVVAMPRGAQVTIDMVGVQYNPRYFPSPEKFQPSRWYGAAKGAQEAEAFTAFSIGPRACIGRKFAITEAVCFLTVLLRDWKVEPLLNEGESVEEWKERVLQASLIFTLSIRAVPVKFIRRPRL
ncbi:hypothetical protein NM688_g5063 [Phlebia brevispora]|uniref:Uncharacterized protein n=1 Tax=Phlebia brevispora TaxID=194682 RepID=A0ACC1T161_9APHY|nr:hypothetical protein NM688_g5063 [Phlebia brevispora]